MDADPMLTSPMTLALLALAVAAGFGLGVAFWRWRAQRARRELAQSLDWHAAKIIREREPRPRWFQLLKWAELQTDDDRLLAVLRDGPAWGLYVKDPRANDHLLVIHALTQEGLAPEQIADGLNRMGLHCLTNEGLWTPEIVRKAVHDFGLQRDPP